eukprot:4272990-Alexandrium_andersonii.AAC.1
MAVQARPSGQAALSAAPNGRKSETPLPDCRAHEAPHFPRGLFWLDLQNGVIRLAPNRSRREGRLARWARWNR